jgi:hypothetical protein
MEGPPFLWPCQDGEPGAVVAMGISIVLNFLRIMLLSFHVSFSCIYQFPPIILMHLSIPTHHTVRQIVRQQQPVLKDDILTHLFAASRPSEFVEVFSLSPR